MKKVFYGVLAVRTTTKGEVCLGDSSCFGGVVFDENGELDSFVSCDGLDWFAPHQVVEVKDPDSGWMSLEDYMEEGDWSDLPFEDYEE